MDAFKLVIPIFIGGGIGAIIRYSLSIAVVNYFNSFLPVATLGANLIAVAIMGVSLYYGESKMESYPWVRAFILIGLCGGLSTFSTFSFETALLLKGYHWGYALSNVVISVVLGTLIIYPFVKILNK